MVWSLLPVPTPQILLRQITVWNVCKCLVVFSSVCCCPVVSWGVWGRVFVYLDGILVCLSCLGVFGKYLRAESMQDRVWLEPTHHFGTTLKYKIFSRLILLRHQNTKTALYKHSKNYWVMPFLVICCFIREKLFVTVAFDHPVEHSWDRTPYSMASSPPFVINDSSALLATNHHHRHLKSSEFRECGFAITQNDRLRKRK